ncbi:MAG: hypothetical protein HYT80_01710 [Euryarchaeota archaeon]|nr:hypothetical protein [Euryarchaeota archaeon]
MVEWILNPTKPVEKNMGIVILVLNIVIPGVGTMVYGRILRGVIELLTVWLLVGWIFSIIDGIQIMTKATTGTAAIKS